MPNFSSELNFTQTYRRFQHAHPAIREAECLKAQFPTLFDPIQEGDLFAGRIHYRPVGFGLELASGGPGYYCHADQIQLLLPDLPADERQQVEEMITFWQSESTIDGILNSHLPADILNATSNSIASFGGRLAGALINFEKLVKIGLPGLLAEIEAAKTTARQQGKETEIYTGMHMALHLLVEICLDYARQARARAAAARDEQQEIAWLTLAGILEKITTQKPATLREAMQLAWLYALISGVVNYGRMDVYLGDFLVHDLESGALDETSALRLLQFLWQMMADRKIIFNSRVYLGGRGRPNEANADRFALLAMEATRTVIEVEPQLTLRCYRGMNPALMHKAIDVIGEGRTFPMLYNDDVNIPAVAHAFNVPYDHAEQYLPYGCGEYALDHISFGSPNCVVNPLKALEATLHNGKDAQTGEPLGLALGEFRDFKTYPDLWNAYKKQLEYHTEYLAQRHVLEYAAETASAAFLFISMLFDGCIERGRSVVDRGTLYQGGVAESFGIVNTGDSLAAIKILVYEQKLLSPDQLLAALDADFAGYEREHRMLLAVPKYGNDDDATDAIVAQVSDHLATFTRAQAALVGLDYYLIVNINNYANVYMGKITAASADGRQDGSPLANGNTPTAGNDRSGVTAFLSSIVKLDPSVHAGYVHNMKFNRSMFLADRPKLEALLDTYFATGGTQAMITVVSRADLENALKEPAKYANLIVRVGGFSARFVELAPEVQQDLINRTLY